MFQKVIKTYHSLEYFLEKSFPFFLGFVLIAFLDRIYYFYATVFSKLLHVIIYFSLIFSNTDNVLFEHNKAAENKQVTLSSWIYSGLLLLVNQDKPDLVVAAYEEDLSWLQKYLPYVNHVHIYCKSHKYCTRGIGDAIAQQPSLFTVRSLSNLGRESNTYLYHIKQNYDNLPARTVFTMGSIKGAYGRELSFRYALVDSSEI